MTSLATGDMRMRFSDHAFLPFWVWSTLLHIGAISLLSVLQLTHTVEPKTSTVTVTLIEATTPTQTPSPSQPEQKPPVPQAPPLLKAPRPIAPVPQHAIPSPPPLKPQTIRATLAHVVAPSHPQKRVVQPMPRRVLRDNQAIDKLNLKSFLKAAQRAPASRTASQPIKPQRPDMSSSPIVLSASIPTHPPTALASRTTPSSIHRSLTPLMPKAGATGMNSISKSKVGLGRTIPPVYPRIARESGWEGTVLIRVAVQPDGSPESVRIRRSSGHAVLDNAAVEAVKKWRFSPAKDGNIPIRSIVEIPINFDLRKQG